MAHRKKLANLNLKIDAELKEKLKAKCEQDETSITTVLEDAIRGYLGYNDTDNDSRTDINNDTNNDINTEQLEQRLQRLEGALEGLTCEINPNQLQQKLENQLHEIKTNLETNYLVRDDIVELIREVEEEVHEPTENEVETGLNQTQLAQRLGTSRGSIYKYQKEDQKWQNFCQEKDPDGLIWYKHSNGMYYPDDQPVNLIKGVKELALHLGLKEDELTQDVKEKNVNDLIKFETQTWRIIKKDKDGYWFEKVDKT